MFSNGDLIALIVPCAPLRSTPADASEMCSEALAGETANVLEIGEKDWILIELIADGYRGWSDQKQWSLMAERRAGEEMLKPFLIQAPTSPWLRKNGSIVQLPAGSIVHLDAASKWSFSGIDVEPLFSMEEIFKVHADPFDAANSFLGAPYRWGGRCVWGIDCSGLIQLAFMLCGERLQRDASQQAQEGERVHWDERKRGDLAFFKNDIGHIVHVGILKGPAHIVHAAGEVRLDRLEETGIWSGEQMTHVLAHICRI
jgi:hypothetical protein